LDKPLPYPAPDGLSLIPCRRHQTPVTWAPVVGLVDLYCVWVVTSFLSPSSLLDWGCRTVRLFLQEGGKVIQPGKTPPLACPGAFERYAPDPLPSALGRPQTQQV